MFSEKVIPLDGASNVADLRANVQVLITQDMTQAQVAKEAGISPTSLSKWLSGKHQGDDETIVRKLSAWVEDQRERADSELPDAPSWVETPTSAAILLALRYTHVLENIGVIYGGAGLGKTTTIRHYAAQHPNNVWIVTMTPASASGSACLRRIAWQIGIRDISQRNSDLEQDIVERLTGTKGLLIVDEAQHLFVPALETVRSLHDASGVAVAILGNDSVYSGLVGRRQAEFAQLSSRIGKKLHLGRAKQADIDALAHAWGVSGRHELKELRSIGALPGGLRGVTQTLRMASMVAKGMDQDINASVIRDAWQRIGGDL